MLADMQARLARSAYDALGIEAGEAAPTEIRAAFFELAKTYHPQKFARMSPEIQRLANEVFLALRAAHDQLARRAAPTRASQQLPTLKTSAPELVRSGGSRPNAAPVIARTATPVAGTQQPVIARTATPVAGAQPRTNQPQAPSPAIAPGTVRGVPPANAQPAARPSNAPPPASSSLGAGTQRGAAVPPASSQPIARPTPMPTNTRPTAQSAPLRKATPAAGVPTTGSGARPAVPPAQPAATQVEPELAGVYDLLQRGQWEAARTTLNALIALQPRPRYRALLAYSHGREAQLSRRIDEARVDLHNALEIDPELQVAKTALAELFTRRK